MAIEMSKEKVARFKGAYLAKLNITLAQQKKKNM